ncbi:cell wall-active antibiotics response protein [Paenibacillaceae bacterium]|nr:cell wall-active antibiotics response protein [Paenibacillaceae bacterium]
MNWGDNMEHQMLKRLFWGLIVIGIGVALMLRIMGIVHFSIGGLISTFWPVVLIVIGIDGILKHHYSGGAGLWGWILVVMGVVFLGRNLDYDYFQFSIGQLIPYIVPLVFIYFGITMIFKPKSKHRTKKHEKTGDDWKSYPESMSHVPPAPPLHPDPTKPGNSFPPEMDSNGTEGYRERPDQGMNPPPNGSRHKYGQDSSSCGGNRSRERVEWWNSDPNVQTRSGFIGDIHLGQDYWDLKPMNISHFIGDTTLDLTKAQIPYGETRLTISSFIGDVKVFLPSDYEFGVNVVSSAFIGDSTILDRKEGGLFQNSNIESPAYSECDKRVRIVVSTFIGDVRVTRVG